MAGTIKVDKWINEDGSENYKCRAWGKFLGTNTVQLEAGGNVSSITDNGVGSYTVNFINPMSDLSYSAVASAENAASYYGIFASVLYHAINSFAISTCTSSSSQVDGRTINFVVFR